MQKLVKWLIKEKVLDSKGNLSPEKLQTFYDKYNEDITQRTSRYNKKGHFKMSFFILYFSLSNA